MTIGKPKPSMKVILEALIDEMVRKGILWKEARGQFEKLFIERVLQESRGNLRRAASRLGVHRNTLSKKVRIYGIHPKSR